MPKMTQFWPKKCTVSLWERQFATLHLFHAYTPPPPKHKIPPQFCGHGLFFFLQKKTPNPGVHKIGAAISGPRTAGEKFYRHEAFSDNIRHTSITCTFFVWRIIYTQKRVMLDTKLHLHDKHLFQEFYLLCVLVFGNKAHEVSASWNWTFLVYKPYLCRRITFSHNGTQNVR